MPLSLDHPETTQHVCCRSDGVAHLVTVTPDQSVITGQSELFASDTEAGQIQYALEANLTDQQIAALAEVFDQWGPGCTFGGGSLTSAAKGRGMRIEMCCGLNRVRRDG